MHRVMTNVGFVTYGLNVIAIVWNI